SYTSAFCPPSPFLCSAPPTTALYTLSLHVALPICRHAARGASARPEDLLHREHRDREGDPPSGGRPHHPGDAGARRKEPADPVPDRKSTRLNSSHVSISYAVFCLKI